MMYKTQVQSLIHSYEARVAWGGGDHEEALQEAVNVAFPYLSEENKAELYAQLVEKWEEYRSGMAPRKLWIGVLVNAFMMDLANKSVSSLGVEANRPDLKVVPAPKQTELFSIPGKK